MSHMSHSTDKTEKNDYNKAVNKLKCQIKWKMRLDDTKTTPISKRFELKIPKHSEIKNNKNNLLTKCCNYLSSWLEYSWNC